MPYNPDFVYQPPYSPYLTLVYQDDHIVVANKPSGLLSVPGRAEAHKDSLARRVQQVFPTATVVHRLDLATSGIMIMALNKAAHRHISKQFETRKTRKRYFARVYGELKVSQGEVAKPLIVDWPNRPKQKVDHKKGKPSLTRYERIDGNDKETTVALYPVTGRSHQLRVHMLAIGHPILGDRLYANEEGKAMASRLQLHAESLQITHPHTGESMLFTAPVPFMDTQPAPLPATSPFC